jgi:hypothetical protein
MTSNEIREFEEIYFNKIIDIFHSQDNDFRDNLLKVEDYIRANYQYLDKLWGDKNKAKVAIERLIRYHIYKNLIVENIYPSPLSPDMAIELEDVILCIDAKTIDMCGNPGDDDTIHFQRNQITFDNKLMYGQKIDGYDWPGYSFPSQLENYHNNKPCLTFFITVCYEDDGKNFKLSHVCFCCVPHSQIATEEFDNDLLSNFKTYKYVDKEEAMQYGELYKPLKKIPDDWTKVVLNIKSSKKTNKRIAYIDKNLSDLKNQIFFLRSKEGGMWKICSEGKSARIDKETLKKDREGHLGIYWKALKEFKVGGGYAHGYEATEIYWNPNGDKPEGYETLTLERVSKINKLVEL